MAKRKITSYYRRSKRRRAPVRRTLRTRMKRYKTIQAINPPCQYVRHRYCTDVALNPGLGSVANHMFRCNSVYDPDYTGTGHQPLGHDEWSLRFHRYMVVSARIRVRFSSRTEASASSLVHVGMYKDDNASAPTSSTTIREQGLGRFNLLTGQQGKSVATITDTFSPRKYFCLMDRDLPTEHQANGGTDPATDAYWVLWAAPVDVGDDPGEIYASVTIDFTVKWVEPKTVTAS